MKAITLCKRKGELLMAELQKGLEGVIAAETKISSIIDSQLTYSGYDIDDLVKMLNLKKSCSYYGIIDYQHKKNLKN